MSMKDFVNTLNEEQKKALLDALQDDSSTVHEFVPQEVNKEAESLLTEDFTTTSINSKTRNKRQPVRANKNTWIDTGEDRHITTPEIALTPRNRKSPQKKSVKCHICGKASKVNASLVYGDYYRCDKCTGNR